MTPEQLKNILEAALMTTSGTMSLNRFVSLFEKDEPAPERADIVSALSQLQADYEGRGIELKEVASGYRFQVRNEYADWVNRLFDEKPQRYSRALLETLAIIAYRQPLTRGEIEDIRGVSISSSIIKTLQEREWIRIVGHRDVPGKPELLATTRQFLDYFNLKKLSDLPSLAEIKDFDKLNPDLFEGLEDLISQTGGAEGAETQTAAADEESASDAGLVEAVDEDSGSPAAEDEVDSDRAESSEESAADEDKDEDEVTADDEGEGEIEAENENEEMELVRNDNVVPFSS